MEIVKSIVGGLLIILLVFYISSQEAHRYKVNDRVYGSLACGNVCTPTTYHIKDIKRHKYVIDESCEKNKPCDHRVFSVSIKELEKRTVLRDW